MISSTILSNIKKKQSKSLQFQSNFRIYIAIGWLIKHQGKTTTKKTWKLILAKNWTFFSYTKRVQKEILHKKKEKKLNQIKNCWIFHKSEKCNKLTKTYTSKQFWVTSIHVFFCFFCFLTNNESMLLSMWQFVFNYKFMLN